MFKSGEHGGNVHNVGRGQMNAGTTLDLWWTLQCTPVHAFGPCLPGPGRVNRLSYAVKNNVGFTNIFRVFSILSTNYMLNLLNQTNRCDAVHQEHARLGHSEFLPELRTKPRIHTVEWALTHAVGLHCYNVENIANN